VGGGALVLIVGCLFAVSCSDPAPDEGVGVGGNDASLMTLDGATGPASAGLALTIPDGALADSVTLTIAALSTIPRGAVRA